MFYKESINRQVDTQKKKKPSCCLHSGSPDRSFASKPSDSKAVTRGRLLLSTLTTFKSKPFLHFCSSFSTKDSEKWLGNYYLNVLKKTKANKQTKKETWLFERHPTVYTTGHDVLKYILLKLMLWNHITEPNFRLQQTCDACYSEIRVNNEWHSVGNHKA